MKRTDMINTKDILRQRHGLGLTRNDIAAATGVSAGKVSNVLKRAVQQPKTETRPSKLSSTLGI